MTDLTTFAQNELLKKQLFKEHIYIDTIELVDSVVDKLNCGLYFNVKFKTSGLKDYFINKLSTIRPEAKVINCNCTLDRYVENDFDGLLVFNNLGKCRHVEILEDIQTYNAIRIC